MNDKQKTQLVIVIIAGLLVLYFLNKILGAFGIRKSKGRLEKDAAEQSLIQMRYFEPGYYKLKTHQALGDTRAQQYANDLKKAYRGLKGTDEDAVYSTFAKLTNKTQISEIANQYYMITGKDLKARTLKELNDKEQLKLYNIIRSLPDA